MPITREGNEQYTVQIDLGLAILRGDDRRRATGDFFGRGTEELNRRGRISNPSPWS